MLTLAKVPHPPLETPPITAWSFSRLTAFEECPYRVYLSTVMKAPEPPRDDNHPLERGSRIHKEAEDYLNGTTDTLPKSLTKLADYYTAMKERTKTLKHGVEVPWAVTKDWELCDWWAPDVWFRLKTDYFEFLDPTAMKQVDHKTGKSYGKEVARAQQGQLYAATGFVLYPEVEAISVSFAYIDEGKVTPEINYSRAMASLFLKKFTDRALVLTTCTLFAAKPNRHNCQWCPYGRKVGTGHCQFAVE